MHLLHHHRSRATAGLTLLLAACVQLAAVEAPRAFQLVPQSQLVAPSISAAPIEVVLWIRDTVSADDAAWITGEIQAGLALWEAVETSHIRFTTTTVRGPSRPTIAAHQLLVVVANRADLSSGGTTLPAGRPGEWRGAVADFRTVCSAPCNPFHLIAAHEIGHALGLLHSTLSTRHFGAGIPLMHFAAGGGLSPDDRAAISVAYPDPARPLAAVSGAIAGRCVDPATELPITGINVVAVDVESGRPSVGILSGSAGAAGTFELVGLPPGTYELYFLDAASFGGSFFGLAPHLVQADNFRPFTLGPITVGAGDTLDLADVPIPIEPIAIDAASPRPADATAGMPYEALLSLRGGVRPLALHGDAGLPPGLAGSITAGAGDLPSLPGRSGLAIRGTARALGGFRSTLVVADAHGVENALELDLQVADSLPSRLCDAPATIADARLSFRDLTRPPGSQALTLTATVRLDAKQAAAFDPATEGMQLVIDDAGAGGAEILAFSSERGSAIPGRGADCGSRDGWRARGRSQVYVNRSGALAPGCVPGSAAGLASIELRRDARRPQEVRVKLRTRGSILAAVPEGPLRVTLAFGAAPSAGCGSTHAFAAAGCTTGARRLDCRQ
jgi:hypothetical protein